MVRVDLQKHWCVFGRSDSGKTTLVREKLFRPAQTRIIVLNTQSEHGFGRPAGDWDIRLLRKPGAKINFELPRPSASEDNARRYNAFLAEIVDDCLEFGEKIRHDGDRTTWVYIIVDEAHLLAPKKEAKEGEPRPLKLLATNGARYGVRYCAITQRPALLDHTVISQAGVKILLDLDDAEAPYLTRYKVPDYVQRWVSERREENALELKRNYAVQLGKDWHLCKSQQDARP